VPWKNHKNAKWRESLHAINAQILNCPNLFEIGHGIRMPTEVNLLPFHIFQFMLEPVCFPQNNVFLR